MEFITRNSFDVELVRGEDHAGRAVYFAETNGKATIQTTIDKIKEKLENTDAYGNNSVVYFNFGGVGVTMDKASSPSEVFEKYVKDSAERETTEKQSKEIDMQNWQSEINIILDEQQKKDPLRGLILKLADGNPNVIRILDGLAARFGEQEAGILMRKMENEHVESEKIEEAFEKSGRNIEKFGDLVRNDSQIIFEEPTQEKPETPLVTEIIDTQVEDLKEDFDEALEDHNVNTADMLKDILGNDSAINDNFDDIMNIPENIADLYEMEAMDASARDSQTAEDTVLKRF